MATNTHSLASTSPPHYGARAGWRPRSAEDYGDGGAYPEVHCAQYPLGMGKNGTSTPLNALAVQVDGDGKVKWDVIARRGHDDSRVVQASFKDLIPLRQSADVGEVSLDRPSAEQVEESRRKTLEALSKIIPTNAAALRRKTALPVKKDEAPTFVRYTPTTQFGVESKGDRIFKIVNKKEDPMEPPKFKHKKIPRGPPSPPAPVLHSPPHKLTAEDQEAWKIPPPISNWKNPKGYTVPLDKRLAADGRGLQDITINDKFAQFSEALFTADRHAREEVKHRAVMQQRLAQKEKELAEDRLRKLAQEAREKRAGAVHGDSTIRHYTRSRSQSLSGSMSRSDSGSENEAARERERLRRQRQQENEKQLRQSRMGAEKRMQMMAREQNRDISEKIALGLAKPTQSAETMYDSRLFNQSSGFDTGFNDDQPYDKPLFAAQDTINAIYRPYTNQDDDNDAAGAAAVEDMQKANRFEVLGKVAKGFKGTDAATRSGPVEFELDADPFNIEGLIRDATGGVSAGEPGSSEGQGFKRYGPDNGGGRVAKRTRV